VHLTSPPALLVDRGSALAAEREVLGMARFLLGVNYWPRRSAMYMWQRFDLGEIREDAARIRELGLDIVRFFLMWEAFAPEIDRIDRDALRRLEQMMDTIADEGLRAMPTLFCGHMSGVNWLPAWSLDEKTPHGRFRTITGGNAAPYGIGDFYADKRLLDAQLLLARAVGDRLRAHPALYLWDLGNEFSNLREPQTPGDAASWSERLTEALRETSGIGTTGGIHGEDLERDRNIRPSSIAAPWEVASMHGYSVYSAFAHGRLDAQAVPYLAQLVQSCANKAVLFTEFGNPTCPPPKPSPFACLNEDEMNAYATAVLDRLQRRGALGGFWWCWADYARAIADLPPFDLAPHELTFGIVRNDGSDKPVASALAAFAAQNRQVLPTLPPIVDESTYYADLPESQLHGYASYCAEYDN
jgi:endo-1,4-beta-mannosidase